MCISYFPNHAYFDDDGLLRDSNGDHVFPYDDDYEALESEAEYYADPLSDDFCKFDYE